MARKTQPKGITLTLSRAQALGYISELQNIERNLAAAKRECQEIRKSLEEILLASERERRASENKTIRTTTTTPLKSSLVATKYPQGIASRKDSPPKSLRFMLPVRPVGQRQSEDRSKGGGKAGEKSGDKGSGSKGSEKGGDKKGSQGPKE